MKSWDNGTTCLLTLKVEAGLNVQIYFTQKRTNLFPLRRCIGLLQSLTKTNVEY